MKSITLFFIALFIISCLPSIRSQGPPDTPPLTTDPAANPAPTNSDPATNPTPINSDTAVTGTPASPTVSGTGSTTGTTPGTNPNNTTPNTGSALKDEMLNVAAAGLVAAVVAFF
ncbi:9877_t:CDS:2 [Funneliformis caledonium]|uniref:9877_t:CDS:1 n=1 Tax=Funneliformis caledonium TaxID=1117310 RepID=A0A9N9BI17_9GLOM|nr:9877_t:CDS:2 [Funneliformis caledonium]